jgi:transposase
MPDDFQRIEVITGTGRRRRWTTEEKLRIVEESLQPGMSVSYVARRHGVAANLLFRWRKLMREGGGEALRADGPVVGDAEVRRLEDRVRELERQLGRKTLEVEILKEALARAGSKKPSLLMRSSPTGSSR